MQNSKRELELALLEQKVREKVEKKKKIDAEWREVKEKTNNIHSFFLTEYFKTISSFYNNVYEHKGVGSSFLSLCYAKNLKYSRSIVEGKLFHK